MSAPLSPTQNATALLLQSLVEAQRIARGVEKTQVNPFHRYNYAGTESIILEAKDAMAQTGLALIPRGARVFSIGTRLEPSSDPKAPREVPQLFLAKRWSLVHQGGGVLELEEQVWPVVPEKGRPLDKAVAAADTASLGYLLRNVLMLARVEEGTDLDHPSREDHGPHHHHAAPQKEAPSPAPDVATPEQRRAILEQLEAQGVGRADAAKHVADIVGHGGALSAKEADQVLAALKASEPPAAPPAPAKRRRADG